MIRNESLLEPPNPVDTPRLIGLSKGRLVTRSGKFRRLAGAWRLGCRQQLGQKRVRRGFENPSRNDRSGQNAVMGLQIEVHDSILGVSTGELVTAPSAGTIDKNAGLSTHSGLVIGKGLIAL